MNVIICQYGSRHRYAIPEILDEKGVNVSLYTDSCAISIIGKCAKLMSKILGAKTPKIVKRLEKRIPHINNGIIRCTDMPLIISFINKVIFRSQNRQDISRISEVTLDRMMVKWGVYPNSIIYSMNSQRYYNFFNLAKRKNCKIVIDVYSSLYLKEIVLKEKQKIWNTKISYYDKKKLYSSTFWP